MAFAIRYPPSQVKNELSYSLSVTITSKKNELLYINDLYIPVIPLGANRTKFIDAPVIQIKRKQRKMIDIRLFIYIFRNKFSL
jgi:uncharacterized lipoprotein YbaY